YFKDTSTDVKQEVNLNQLESNFYAIKMFLESGYDEQVDNFHLTNKEKPIKLIDHAEQLLNEQKHELSNLIAMLNDIEISIRKRRDKYISQEIIDTVNYIYRVQNKIPYQSEVNTSIKENTYEETIKNIKNKMEQLEKDGRQFF